jgi:hypothetical protein
VAENKEVPDSNIGVPPARKYANYRTLDNAVPTTCQQDVSSTALYRLVKTRCDNAVPTTCQQDMFSTGL